MFSFDTRLPAAALRVFLPFAAGYFLSYLLRVVNAVIAPDLIFEMNLGPSALGLLTAAYFISFAAFQLPLGILLDRFGPRRVEAGLLVFAGGGALLFAGAQTLATLVLARALIGLGVCACLMAAFKAFVLWFPRQQLPMINGFQMAAGGLGALTATAPVEAAMGLVGWRGVFLALGVLSLAVAAAIFCFVPEKEAPRRDEDFAAQAGGILRVYASAVFWKIAPWTAMSQATFLAVQGLWVGPWLNDVAGYDRTETGRVLLLVAAAMVAGFGALGALVGRLARSGIAPMHSAAGLMTLFMIVQALLILGDPSWAVPLWLLFGFFGTSGILPYGALSQLFPAELTGRLNTALNLMVFVTAFLAQWGIGVLIGLWPASAEGGYSEAGYQAGFGAMLALQFLGLLWFGGSGLRKTAEN